MGRHTYHGDTGSRERGVKVLHEKVSIGAVGAPTAQKELSMSIVRDSAGVYTCTLLEKFTGLLLVSVMQSGVLQDLTFHVTSDDVASAGTFELTCASAGVATDPTAGTELHIKAEVKDSSVAY